MKVCQNHCQPLCLFYVFCKFLMDKFSKIIIASAVAVNVYDGEQLNLTRISRTEMGAYLCIATNGVPPSVSKRIIVDVECKYTMSFMYLFILIHSKNEIFFDAVKKCRLRSEFLARLAWFNFPGAIFVLCRHLLPLLFAIQQILTGTNLRLAARLGWLAFYQHGDCCELNVHARRNMNELLTKLAIVTPVGSNCDTKWDAAAIRTPP
jgi:hypothetical protein